MQTRRTLGVALGATAIAMSGTAAAQTPSIEATFDRIRRTGVLRIAALPGERPFFHKDITTGEWSGVAIDMEEDLRLGAKTFAAFIAVTSFSPLAAPCSTRLSDLAN